MSFERSGGFNPFNLISKFSKDTQFNLKNISSKADSKIFYFHFSEINLNLT